MSGVEVKLTATGTLAPSSVSGGSPLSMAK